MTQKETVAYYLKNKDLDKALAFAKEIKQTKNKVIGLDMIFQKLCCTQQFGQALEVAKLIAVERKQTQLLKQLLNEALACQDVGLAHQVAQNILSPRSQSAALKQVADYYLQQGQAKQALALVTEVKALKTQTNLLKGVSERLLESNLTEALLAAERIKDMPARLQLLEKLTHQIISQHTPTQVLDALVYFKDALSKVWVWALVSGHLPKTQGRMVLGEALKVATSLNKKYEKALGIAQIAFYIFKLLGHNKKVDKLFTQAIDTAEKVWKDTEKLHALAHIVGLYIKIGHWSDALAILEQSINRVDVNELLQKLIKQLYKEGYTNEADRLKQETSSVVARIMRSQRVKKLIKVSNENTSRSNNYYYYSYDDENKFYNMTDNDDGTFTVEYGRIGEPYAQTYAYPIEEWAKKYKEKLRKGYKDVTYMHQTNDQNQAQFASIASPSIAQLVQELQMYARQSVQDNYVVNAQNVTFAQLEEAQELLNEMSAQVDLLDNGHTSCANIDKLLLQLFTIIPRKMDFVDNYLTAQLGSDIEVRKRISEEQATLDVMRGEVLTLQSSTNSDQLMTLTEAMGIKIDIAELSDVMTIRQLMGNKYFDEYFQNAYKVTNLKTQKVFDQQVNNAQNRRTKLLWHGSRNENWWSILKTGLVLRPTNAVITGKMFGYGLYFADKVNKSMGYSSLYGSFWTSGESNKAYLAIYDVHLGNCIRRNQHECWMYDLDKEALNELGNYDSFFARGGIDLVNNEYIVYQEPQCTIKYLVEIHS